MTIQLHDYNDGSTLLEAAVVRPGRLATAPAVLIAHQWAGRGEGEHQTAELLAAHGYVGIAIDMFGKGVAGDPNGDNSALIGPWLADRVALARRMTAAVDFARSLDGVDQLRIAAIGYCFGGLCVLDLARTGTSDVVGVVSLHGLLESNGLDAAIAAKVLVEHGWRDPMATPDKVLAFATEMAARDADWQLHAHGRAVHAFTNKHADAADQGMQYDANADRRSWRSTIDFLDEVLKAP